MRRIVRDKIIAIKCVCVKRGPTEWGLQCLVQRPELSLGRIFQKSPFTSVKMANVVT